MSKASEQTTPVPPHNLDAEESILGAMMLATEAIDAVVDIVSSADFYRASHADIFEACVSLHDAGEPVDAITVADKLDQLGQLEELGGPKRIKEIATLVPSTMNAAHYASIVRALSIRRALLVAGEKIQRLGWDAPHPPAQLVEQAEGLVFDLARDRQRDDFVPIREPLARTFARMEEMHEQGVEFVGLQTGYRDIDRMTSGLQDGNLVVVAARPSMGKTAFALGVAADVAVRQAKAVAVFTLEMSQPEIVQRLLAIEGFVEIGGVRRGNLSTEEWRRVSDAGSRLHEAPLFVNDRRAITMTEVRSSARRLAMRHDVALVVVDYLQLLGGAGRVENRVQEVSQITRSLKVLAGELDVPVLALSQLSRQVESRHDKRPILSDLRESGSIEQDADLVLFVYRDEYYHPEDTDQQGIAEINFAKNRNGPTETVKLSFVKRYARFSDLARHQSLTGAA